MEISLKSILRDALIIPFSDEKVERMEQICEKYLTNISLQEVEFCIRSFVTNEAYSNLEHFFKEELKTDYSENIQLPPLVYIILAEYVVYLAINSDNPNISEKSKALYSLAVRNTIILRKGSYHQLLTSSIIAKLYDYVDEFRCRMCSIQKPQEEKLTPYIYNSDNFGNININDVAFFEEVKYMAKITAKTDYEILVSGIKKSFSNLFLRAYHCAYELVFTPKWEYVDQSPVMTLIKLLKGSSVSKSLPQIREYIINSDDLKIIEKDMSTSSVLLQYITGSTDLIKMSKLTFTPIEFGVYLYYEFFFERIKQY